MKRWHMEEALMRRRMREERAKHAVTRDATETPEESLAHCHCAAGLGTMRKHRPYENYNHSWRFLLACYQHEKRQTIKRLRRQPIHVEETEEWTIC